MRSVVRRLLPLCERNRSRQIAWRQPTFGKRPLHFDFQIGAVAGVFLSRCGYEQLVVGHLITRVT
jgi:hypothetical protein